MFFPFSLQALKWLTLFCQVVKAVADVRNFFGPAMYHTIIPRNVRLAEAPSFGKQIIDYDPKAQGAKAYTLNEDPQVT